jgi:carbon-monoxide dehydrogenase large subunit
MTIAPADGYGSFASRSAVLGGSAVFQGGAALLDKIHAAAARCLKLSAGRDRGHRRCCPDPIWSLGCTGGTGSGGLKVDASSSNDQRLTYAYGTAAAHVAIDPGTGGGTDRLSCRRGCWPDRQPANLHGQLIGATVQGLGGAFMEDLV